MLLISFIHFKRNVTYALKYYLMLLMLLNFEKPVESKNAAIYSDLIKKLYYICY